MSKRVTLTDEDIDLIGTALDALLRDSSSLSSVYPERSVAARQRFKQVKDKLKTEPSSQMVSSDSAANSIADTSKE